MEFVPMEKELAIMESSINGSPYRLPTSSTTRSLDLPSFIKYNSPRWLLHEAIGPSTQEVFQRNSSTPTSLVSDDIKVIWIWILHKIRILCLSWTLQTLIEVLYSRWRILKRLRDFFSLDYLKWDDISACGPTRCRKGCIHHKLTYHASFYCSFYSEVQISTRIMSRSSFTDSINYYG